MSAGEPPTLQATRPLVLDRYRLSRRLGTGAFGTVWMARDERLRRDVAIKLTARERTAGGRLEREAQAAARLSHPGIVTLFEAARDDDHAYLVCELVHGSTFGELLRAGSLSDRDILAIGMALCDALAHAHRRGVVHRDVKPSNVLVPEVPTSAAGVAKLTDFGVARIAGSEVLTQAGEVLGTVAYMPPEQAAGRSAGPPADVYALAVVLYEALTGVNPLLAGSPGERPSNRGAYLPALRRRRRDLPRELGCAVDLSLRPRPSERATVTQLRDALAASLDQVDDTPHGANDRASHHVDQPAPPSVLSPRAAVARPAADVTPATATGTWPARALAGLAAAALTGWITAHLLAPPPVAPASAALLAAVIVVALPRAGWLGLSMLLALGTAAAGRPGGSLVIALGSLVPVVLLPNRATAWPLAAAAPGLGALGMAGVWPAIAGRFGSAWQRGALGLAGWVWLALAGPLAGEDLYLRRPAAIPPPLVWTPSLRLAVHDALLALLSSGALLAGAVWALAAIALPWLVRDRRLAVDATVAVLWSALVCAATIAVLRVGGNLGTPRGAAIGAAVSVAVALAPSILRAWRSQGESLNRRPDLRSMEPPLTL